MNPSARLQKLLDAKVELQSAAKQQNNSVPFILASTDIGPLILSRLDYRQLTPSQAYGVGFQLLETGTYESKELEQLSTLLDLRIKYHSPSAVMIDCGANIGVHTVNQARRLKHTAAFLAIEAQERLFYALCGNVALNNCFNVRCIHAALTDRSGAMNIPDMNYYAPGSYGSLELKRTQRQDTGQFVNYDRTIEVQALALDDLKLPRVDLIKIDVEGMELHVIAGAMVTLHERKPVLVVEKIKSDADKIRYQLGSLGYELRDYGMNFIAIHKDDPTIEFFGLHPPA